MSLFGWLKPSISEAEVRAEIWNLGQRHLGWPLEGALKELESGEVDPARANLLRACVRQLRTH